MEFSNLEYSEKPVDTRGKKRKNRDRFTGRDILGVYKKVQKRNAHVEEVREQDPERAQRLAENIALDKALKRARGEKVKDDESRLLKAIKRKTKLKVKRKQAWEGRVEKVQSDKQRRQEKRQTNIDKRRDDKIKKKKERARKKGRIF